MTEVRDELLSALLDGELNEREAARVQAAMAADPALRRQFETLERLHAQLVDTADQFAFLPGIELPRAAPAPVGAWLIGATGVLALLAIRLLPKFVDLAVAGIVVQVVACIAIAFVIVRMSRRAGALATQYA